MTYWGAGTTAWAAWTAIGTLALAVATFAAILVSLRTARAERDRWLRERQMLDADVVADADQVLMDIHPERRGINANSAVEGERWAGIWREARKTSRDLVRLAGGHPDPAVRDAATELSSAVLRAATQSEWHVRDVLAIGTSSRH